MNLFETQYKEIINSLEFGDYDFVLKRIIDLTLDTEDLSLYEQTCNLLSWVDYNKSNIDGKKEKYFIILNHLYEILSKKKTKKDKELLVEIKGFKKSYSQSSFSLGPINLNIFEGEIIGLIGENGNGKTSLLRSICGELAPTEGEILYNFIYQNNDILRNHFVYIPQRTNNWYGKMLDNLYFTASSYGIKGKENVLLCDLIISRMGLRDFQKMEWKHLSSGYKMRFELARMLLRKPKLLLIDEPLANLDIISQQTILNDFIYLAKSPFRPLGVILSSQQLYAVEKTSDIVIFLKNGEQKTLYFNQENEDNEIIEQKLCIEFESNWNKEQLYQTLKKLNLLNLENNGGTYIATFDSSVHAKDFLQLILDADIPLLHYRNISNSSRRFFN